MVCLGVASQDREDRRICCRKLEPLDSLCLFVALIQCTLEIAANYRPAIVDSNQNKSDELVGMVFRREHRGARIRQKELRVEAQFGTRFVEATHFFAPNQCRQTMTSRYATSGRLG